MSYELEFSKTALKKFDKLNPQIAEQFIRKLEAILDNPKIPKNKLRGSVDLYKIKLKSAGYRLWAIRYLIKWMILHLIY
ncbi:type II toxin-antitoxin system RelE/ParE family toxin [Acinetobacter baumannii]|nr:type II toxin-antitoxin system RelE/ParE family toxin [Acinetobacter baumannii]